MNSCIKSGTMFKLEELERGFYVKSNLRLVG